MQYITKIEIKIISDFILFFGYLNPPTIDDLKFNFAFNKGLWYYANQKVYIGSMQDDLIIFLLFLIGTRNIRNHPRLAKFISPLVFGFINLVDFITQNMFSIFLNRIFQYE